MSPDERMELELIQAHWNRAFADLQRHDRMCTCALLVAFIIGALVAGWCVW